MRLQDEDQGVGEAGDRVSTHDDSHLHNGIYHSIVIPDEATFFDTHSERMATTHECTLKRQPILSREINWIASTTPLTPKDKALIKRATADEIVMHECEDIAGTINNVKGERQRGLLAIAAVRTTAHYDKKSLDTSTGQPDTQVCISKDGGTGSAFTGVIFQENDKTGQDDPGNMCESLKATVEVMSQKVGDRGRFQTQSMSKASTKIHSGIAATHLNVESSMNNPDKDLPAEEGEHFILCA